MLMMNLQEKYHTLFFGFFFCLLQILKNEAFGYFLYLLLCFAVFKVFL